MLTVIENISEKIADVFESLGYKREYGAVSVSARPDLCQFQCNSCFAAAKEARKAPFDIAAEVAEAASKQEIFTKVEAVRPGFVNITVTDEYLVSCVNELISNGNFGIKQVGAGKNLIVDYGGANVAKPLHIGHLRPAILGEALKRMARICGYNAIGDVHMGDWGMPLGLVIAELYVRHPEWKCFCDEFDPAVDKVEGITVDDLNEIYPFASKKSKEDEEFKELAHKMTCDLQDRKPNIFAVWQEIMRISVADLKKNYGKLGVSFELWYGESDSDKYIPELLEILDNKGLSRVDDGALVVDVADDDDKSPMPPVIVKKSDGSSNYATTDLATILQREQDYAPAAIWYVVDKRQALHFKQVFRAAKKSEIVNADCDMYHLGNGTMNGSDGKPFKTRDGGVMRLEELLNSVVSAVMEKLSENAYASEEEKLDAANKIAMAAIKFGDMINQPTKDYVFDIDKFISFEGKTGSYLLYTVTRINSIMRKAGECGEKISGIWSDAERDIIIRMLLTCDVFQRAINEKAPNVIAENAYFAACDFSRFYHDCRIIDEADENKKSSRLALCKAVNDYLKMQLNVLGIETVEKM